MSANPIPPTPPDLGAICARLISRAASIEQLQREQDTDLRDVLRLVERVRQADAHDTTALRLLSMTELAELSGVSRATLYRLADTGELPARKVGGSWRISVADYRAWAGGSGA